VKVYETTRKKTFRAAAAKSQPSPSAARVAPIFRTCIRKIVAQSDHSRKTNATNSDDSTEADHVLMDVEIDGVRCLLVRSEKPTKAVVKLSPREQEIVRMIAKGYPNKAIAAVLEISSWTVCTHLRRVFAKLGVSSRAAMVARILEQAAFPHAQAEAAASARRPASPSRNPIGRN
jgi:DNA-binding CsgD family transcriptional regulator